MRSPSNLALFAAACFGGTPVHRTGRLKMRQPLLLRTSSSAAVSRPAAPLLTHMPTVNALARSHAALFLDRDPDLRLAVRSRRVANRQVVLPGHANFHSACALFQPPEHLPRSRLIGQPTPHMHPHLMQEGEGAQFASETAFANLMRASVYRSLTSICLVGD